MVIRGYSVDSDVDTREYYLIFTYTQLASTLNFDKDRLRIDPASYNYSVLVHSTPRRTNPECVS